MVVDDPDEMEWIVTCSSCDAKVTSPFSLTDAMEQWNRQEDAAILVH